MSSKKVGKSTEKTSKATKGAKQCSAIDKESTQSVVENASSSSSYRAETCGNVDDSVIGYVHKLSPQKRKKTHFGLCHPSLADIERNNRRSSIFQEQTPVAF